MDNRTPLVILLFEEVQVVWKLRGRRKVWLGIYQFYRDSEEMGSVL